MYLSSISVSEFVELKVNVNQATKSTMKKQQINAIPLVTNAQATLTTNESEVVAKLEQKCLSRHLQSDSHHSTLFHSDRGVV